MLESLEIAVPAQPDDAAEEVRRAKLRDEETWSAWYDRYYRVLYRYALARTGTREEAEDIAAQAFVRALEGIDRYDYRGRPVLAWLYRITHNLVADHNRRDRRKPAIRLEDAPMHDLHDHGIEVSNIELQDALARLKPDHREVLVLRFLVDLSHRETAAIMGKTEAAVYSLQVRAIDNLRRAIKE